jgi:hypothetical protein
MVVSAPTAMRPAVAGTRTPNARYAHPEAPRKRNRAMATRPDQR